MHAGNVPLLTEALTKPLSEALTKPMHAGNVLFCLDPAEKAVIVRQMGGFVAAIDCRWFSQCLRQCFSQCLRVRG
jgi:hypothetical protein